MPWIIECVVCGESFEAQRGHARYCSGACKQREWRKHNVYSPADDDTGDDLLQLLEEAAEMLRKGQSPLRKLKRIAKLTSQVQVNDWLVRNGLR